MEALHEHESRMKVLASNHYQYIYCADLTCFCNTSEQFDYVRVRMEALDDFWITQGLNEGVGQDGGIR